MILRKLSLLRSFVVVVLLTSLSAFAADAYEKLLLQDTRPTMEQVEKVKVPEQRGIPVYYNRSDNQDWKKWEEGLRKYGPKLIAALESTYPGATWAFTGRDAQAIGDLVEAFYRATGQKDRVVRLGVSKASFDGASSKDLVSLLEGSGFSLANVQKDPPFIIVDTISGGNGRQGRQLVGAVYKRYAKAGGSPADIVRKMNIFGLRVSTYSGTPVEFTKADALLKKHAANIKAGKITDYAEEHVFPSFKDPGNRFNETGYVHFTSAWHDSYGPLQKTPKGMLAQPVSQFGPTERKTVLWFQKRIQDVVQDESFANAVVKEAKELGYEFPTTRAMTLKPAGSCADLYAKQKPKPKRKPSGKGQ